MIIRDLPVGDELGAAVGKFVVVTGAALGALVVGRELGALVVELVSAVGNTVSVPVGETVFAEGVGSNVDAVGSVVGGGVDVPRQGKQSQTAKVPSK